MSREIGTLNQAEVDASHLHEVILVKLEFDTPVYVHSGFGSIVYDSNTYTGVGDFGDIAGVKESETLGPAPIKLSLTGVDSAFITEALDSGNYGDVVTIYVGFRQDDGTLVEDPWLAWRGAYEYASLAAGEENTVEITAQHDLQVLDQNDGSRFSEEEQFARWGAGDTGLDYVTEMGSLTLAWAGGRVGGLSTGGPGGGGGPGPGDPGFNPGGDRR